MKKDYTLRFFSTVLHFNPVKKGKIIKGGSEHILQLTTGIQIVITTYIERFEEYLLCTIVARKKLAKQVAEMTRCKLRTLFQQDAQGWFPLHDFGIWYLFKRGDFLGHPVESYFCFWTMLYI